MKKAFGIVLGVAAIAGITVAVVPAARDEIHWLWASHKDDAGGYKSYVGTWPTGRHIDEATRLYEERGWSDAQTASSVQGFARYVRDHPSGRHVAEAKETMESLQWQHAKASPSSIQGFERYVQDHPNGKHVAEARDAIESLEWQSATATNTVKSVQQYLDKYPTGRFVREGKSRQVALRADDAPFLAAQQKATEEAFMEFLSDFPGHKREPDARAALKDLEGRDIVDLVRDKKIEVQSQGDGIERVSVKARRLVPYPVVVRIPVGTFFVSSSESTQNMVTTAESKYTLRSDGWESLSPSVACANRPRDIPGSSDRFTVERSPHQADLKTLMPLIEKAGAGFAVRQAAVWIVTDNADYSDLGILVSTPAYMPAGFGGTREINEYEAVRAMQICDEAGIDITQKAIWRDKQKLLDGLKDEALKKWLQDRKEGNPAPTRNGSRNGPPPADRLQSDAALRARGLKYRQTNEYGKAHADFARAIELGPNEGRNHNALAWFLATCPEATFRNGQEAIKHAMRACEIANWSDPYFMDTLAAAYAESGDFKNAVVWQTKALGHPQLEK